MRGSISYGSRSLCRTLQTRFPKREIFENAHRQKLSARIVEYMGRVCRTGQSGCWKTSEAPSPGQKIKRSAAEAHPPGGRDRSIIKAERGRRREAHAAELLLNLDLIPLHQSTTLYRTETTLFERSRRARSREHQRLIRSLSCERSRFSELFDRLSEDRVLSRRSSTEERVDWALQRLY